MTTFDYTGAHDMSLSPYLLGNPANLVLPDALTPMLKAYDAALELWTNALGHAESTRHTLAAAPEQDRLALVTALETGKGDPGSKHHATADRAALVADEQLRLTARAVSNAAEAVEVEIRAHRTDVLAAAIDRERAQITAVSAAWKQVTDQLNTVTGEMTSTIGTHVNWVMSVLGDRTRIEPIRADLPPIHAAMKDNVQALAELERIAHVDALVE